jgi:hypothetical protein
MKKNIEKPEKEQLKSSPKKQYKSNNEGDTVIDVLLRLLKASNDSTGTCEMLRGMRLSCKFNNHIIISSCIMSRKETSYFINHPSVTLSHIPDKFLKGTFEINFDLVIDVVQ